MPDDENDPVSHQLLGGRHSLLGIAEVVDRDEPHLLAEHAARRVDVGYCHLRAALSLLADPGEPSRHRSRDADQHLRPRGAKRGRERDDGCGDDAVHVCTPLTVAYANPVRADSPFGKRDYLGCYCSAHPIWRSDHTLEWLVITSFAEVGIARQIRTLPLTGGSVVIGSRA